MDLTKNILIFDKEQWKKTGFAERIYDTKTYDNMSVHINYIVNNFCGQIQSSIGDYNSDNIYYLTGDVNTFDIKQFTNTFYIVNELTYGFPYGPPKDDSLKLYIKQNKNGTMINIGKLPININNVGVYFRHYFDYKDYFSSLTKEHQFQDLTESNKPGTSYRKGIYITNVDKIDETYKFKLLRCSTNLKGPTDNIRETDTEIINRVNKISKNFFEGYSELNHVLAQIYNNTIIENKEKKAKIKCHSDKTKDMPSNGLMAFCTFYDFSKINKYITTNQIKKYDYDYYYKDTSVLTKLRFRLKNMVNDEKYIKEFDITLYPNSVFIMPLLMNRLYTHEIVPPHISIDKMPTRMGYVIRCSKTDAIFNCNNNQTYIMNDNKLIKLEKPTEDDIKKLKELYADENLTDKVVEYNNIYFSLNDGDYTKPNY